jgi:hypothetical protein
MKSRETEVYRRDVPLTGAIQDGEGGTMAGRFMLPWERWHNFAGSVDIGDPERGDRYLYPCGRWNSERHLRVDGVVADEIPPRGVAKGGGKPRCVHCEEGHEQGDWTAKNLGMDDGSTRLHLRTASGGKWHFVITGGAVTSAALGGVYLMTCGRWTEQAKVKVLHASGRKPTSGTICKKCFEYDLTGQEPGE